MADVHNKEQRRKNMRAIKSADTSIEVRVRKMLWHAGYRYRLNVKSLPGTPDIYLPKYRAAIQINGCLWHGHYCPQFVLPKTRTEFWKDKISGNVQRDLRNISESRQQNVRVLLIWECAIRGNGRLEPNYLLKLISRWLPTDDSLSVVDKQGIRSTSLENLKAQFNEELNLT